VANEHSAKKSSDWRRALIRIFDEAFDVKTRPKTPGGFEENLCAYIRLARREHGKLRRLKGWRVRWVALDDTEEMATKIQSREGAEWLADHYRRGGAKVRVMRVYRKAKANG